MEEEKEQEREEDKKEEEKEQKRQSVEGHPHPAAPSQSGFVCGGGNQRRNGLMHHALHLHKVFSFPSLPSLLQTGSGGEGVKKRVMSKAGRICRWEGHGASVFHRKEVTAQEEKKGKEEKG